MGTLHGSVSRTVVDERSDTMCTHGVALTSLLGGLRNTVHLRDCALGVEILGTVFDA